MFFPSFKKYLYKSKYFNIGMIEPVTIDDVITIM